MSPARRSIAAVHPFPVHRRDALSSKSWFLPYFDVHYLILFHLQTSVRLLYSPPALFRVPCKHLLLSPGSIVSIAAYPSSDSTNVPQLKAKLLAPLCSNFPGSLFCRLPSTILRCLYLFITLGGCTRYLRCCFRIFYNAPLLFLLEALTALPLPKLTQPSTNELPIVFRDTSCPVSSRTRYLYCITSPINLPYPPTCRLGGPCRIPIPHYTKIKEALRRLLCIEISLFILNIVIRGSYFSQLSSFSIHSSAFVAILHFLQLFFIFHTAREIEFPTFFP